MKKVLILFGKCCWDKSRPFDNKDYMYSYEYFYTLCKKNRIQMFRASHQWYDYRKNIFKYAWIFEGKNAKWKRVYNVEPDLIYDKTKATPEAYYKKEKMVKNYKFFNDLNFTKLIDNKLYASIAFSRWSKKSWLVNSFDELRSKLRTIKSKRVVLKPLEMSGGNGILIENKKSILEILKKERVDLKNYIVQEFVDSSGGIPGIMNGIHDLRLVFVNDELVYAYYRKPAEGSLLANLAQGGTMEIVPIKKLPKELDPLIKDVKEKFIGFCSKIFTADVFFDKKKKPWLVELNSMPGMFFGKGQEETREYFYKKLLKSFKTELL